MSRVIAFLIALLLAAPAYAQDFVYFKKKAAVVAGGTNYCADPSAQLCLLMTSATDETDVTANGYTFTVTSSPNSIPTSATVPTGYAGTSRDFELADSEWLVCDNNTCTNLNINGADAKITIAAWVNPESATGTTEQNVVAKWNATGNQRQYRLEIRATTTNEYKVNCAISSNGSGAVSVDSTTTNYATGTWHHIACVSNDTDVRVYVDGELNSTPGALTTGIFDSTDGVAIGAAASSALWFDGLIDEVIILNRDLSSTEIAELYTNGISGDKGGSD